MKFASTKNQPPLKSYRDLDAGLNRRMKMGDQFNNFTISLTIEASEEVKFPNYLRDLGGNSKIPSEWLVMDAQGAPSGSLMRGAETWSKDFLTLVNTAATTGTFKVRFLE